MTVSLVRFTPGARTNWHRHAVGQTLHVTDGVGLAAANAAGSVTTAVRARGLQALGAELTGAVLVKE